MPGTKSLEKSLEKKYHDILSDCLPVGRRITGELLEYMRTRGWKICIARRIDRNSSIIEELNSISKSKKYVIDDIDRIRKEIVVR